MDLPDDPTIEQLDEHTREAVAAHWVHRAASELSVAIAFRRLRPRLQDVGAVAVVLGLVDKAVTDEERHAALCMRLAARYAGRELAMPAGSEREHGDTQPSFGTRDERSEVALTVIGMCCINESIASEWIRSCWQVSTSPTALAANKAHLQDEIDHARLGWAHVASSAVPPELKARLRPRIPRMVEVNVAEWKRTDPHLPARGVEGHGHLGASVHESVIDVAVRDVVLPGLRHVELM